MKEFEIIQLISVKSINNDIEEFSGNVFRVMDDDSYLEDFPDKIEKFRVSRTLHKKLFSFLMDKGMRDGHKISFSFIKKEIGLT